jgi:hypothetical protein
MASHSRVGAAGSATPASGQATDVFVIGYGDTVSDGVPGPGAGHIEAGGDIDVYTFEGTAGDQAIFDVLAGSAGTFRWDAEAPDGTDLFGGLFTDRRVALPQTGTYAVAVRGANAATTGTYSFRLLLTPPPEQFAIGFGDTVSEGVPAAGAGNVEGPGALDIYTFEAAAGQTAIFDLLDGDNVRLGWRLTAPDGTTLFDTFVGDRQLILPATGTYTLTVGGNGVDDSGTYSFQLLEVPPVVDEFTIAFGDTVSNGVPAPGAGNIESPGAIDRYRFEATAGKVAVFDVLAGDTNVVRWSLQAPDGSIVFDEFFVDNDVALTQTGTYVVTVRGLQITDVGTYSFQLLEAAPNTPPVAVDDAVVTDEGVPVTIDVLANDSHSDGDVLAVDAVSQPGHGVAVIEDGDVTYTPESGFAGIDSFTYTVVDGRGGSAEATVTVTVREVVPPNQPPTIAAVADQQNVEGDLVALVVEAEDPDADMLTFSAEGLPAGLAIDPTSGEISGTIEVGAATDSPYTVEVTVTDPDGATASTEFGWMVRTAPVWVEVDVVPGKIVNDGHALILVVIFGDADVEAQRIDARTVELEGMPVATIFGRPLAVRWDVNHDGYKDLIVLIDDVAGTIPAGITTVTLTARLHDGTVLAGTDEVHVVSRGRHRGRS